MAETNSATIVNIQDLRNRKNILEEAIAVATQAVSSAVMNQAHRAAVCGCRGCRAQAIEATEWASTMLESTWSYRQAA